MELTAFRHQVGGHFGILSCNGHVAKPSNLREMAFYKVMNSELKYFSPAFCKEVDVRATANPSTGQIVVETLEKLDCHKKKSSSKHERSSTGFRLTDDGRVTVDTEKQWNPWAAECQCKVVERMLKEPEPTPFLLLENVVAHYSRPCVLDLKIGTRQHGDDASESKRHRQLMKCRHSTSATLGVRVVGMQMLSKLRSLLAEFEGYRFFSASILIAFDAEAADSSDDDAVKVCIIDFAHSTFSGFFEDLAYSGADEGCLLGLDSIVDAMEPTITKEPVTPVSSYEKKK
ncbi:hypothetical protein B9Z55_001489 [Caenorhabditis nigoni]|uniref:Kinase n=1 Tax=Caenorhabditis nigoni TaxID=1611254 RepID=A0A2G5VFW8_9PELO|nr:hypothetical protein B9Z55_001489 [Caenorhabditis nigoni]